MTSATVPEDLLSALVAEADDAVIVADAEGAIRFWNRAAERMFGHARDQAVGRSLDLIIPDKLRGRHWDGYARVMATGETERPWPKAEVAATMSEKVLGTTGLRFSGSCRGSG